jgi:NAD(P)-dependent dehydrogenase (short-subunit alcohol dehydrogenase family)
VVFANAGIADRTVFEEVDEAAFDKVVNVNLKGAYFSVKYSAPYLNEGSSVILTSSCLHEMGLAGLSVYAATKAAVRSLALGEHPKPAIRDHLKTGHRAGSVQDIDPGGGV